MRRLHIQAGVVGVLIGVAAVGGLLGSVIGLRAALWVATLGGVTGFALLLPTPLPRYRLPSEG